MLPSVKADVGVNVAVLVTALNAYVPEIAVVEGGWVTLNEVVLSSAAVELIGSEKVAEMTGVAVLT